MTRSATRTTRALFKNEFDLLEVELHTLIASITGNGTRIMSTDSLLLISLSSRNTDSDILNFSRMSLHRPQADFSTTSSVDNDNAAYRSALHAGNTEPSSKLNGCGDEKFATRTPFDNVTTGNPLDTPCCCPATADILNLHFNTDITTLSHPLH